MRALAANPQACSAFHASLIHSVAIGNEFPIESFAAGHGYWERTGKLGRLSLGARAYGRESLRLVLRTRDRLRFPHDHAVLGATHLLLTALASALGVACGAPAQPAAPVFAGRGATLDPGPAAGTVEAGALSSDPCAAPSPLSDEAHVEDFEDGDNRLFGGFEREGYWYSATDHTPSSSVFPPEGTFQASKLPDGEATLDNQMAAHLTAEGQKDWGVTWGTTLRHVGAAGKCALNVSRFRGLRFRARGTGSVTLRFGMPEDVASEYGGRCVERCWDLHSTTLHLSPDWQTREVRWDQLQQAGWGKAVRFDPERLLSIELAASPANLPANLWVDDLAWIPAEPAK